MINGLSGTNSVLALLTFVGSSFQARFTGPQTVLTQISEENYLISTPEQRKKSLCHVGKCVVNLSSCEHVQSADFANKVMNSSC